MSDSLSDVPDDDQVVRYVGKQLIREDGNPDGSAFQLRHNRPDDTGLSVNWLEILGNDKLHQLAEVRRLSRLTLRSNGRLAEMNVGMVKHKISEELKGVRIVHKPLEAEENFEADPSHSEITGLPLGDSDEAMLVGDLIAECVVSMHPAVSTLNE